MRVLLVEDDAETAAFVRAGLSAEGLQVEHAGDGPAGFARANVDRFDVIILDRLLPGRDGLSVLRGLRGAGIRTPVLCLTAVDGLGDRVEGFEAGADDYLIKPFFLVELLARLRALVRRCAASAVQTHLRAADLQLDLLGRTVTRAGREIALLPQEFRLLEFLARNAGSVVTRSMLLERVWDIHFDPQTSVVETHVSRLRAKLAHGAAGVEYIRTVRGSGYLFVASP